MTDEYITDDVRLAVRQVLIEHGIEDPLVLKWVRFTFDDINQAIPKSREYGSAELRYLGEMLDSMAANPLPVDPSVDSHMGAYERAISFYLIGKVGRWISALRRGQFVSPDTLLDITTYSMMARLVRFTGRWT